jgi:hypothetical protein
MAAFEVLSLDPAVPQIRAPGAGDTYSVPREMAISVNTATDALRITQTGAGNALVVEDSANPDATPFVVTAAGDVGIGTNSPSEKLEVAGGRIKASVTTTGATYFYASNSVASTYYGTDSVGGYILTSASVPLLFYTNNTEKMRITSAGNVGIGTSSLGMNTNALPLVVGSGSGNTGMTIFSGSAASGSIHFADAETTGPDSYRGAIAYTHTNNSMSFFTDATERMRITSAGNVNIGNGETNASPANALLQATGGSGTDITGATLTIQGGRGTGSSAGGPIVFSTSAAGASGTTLRTATERMRITSAGELLVGGTTEVNISAFPGLGSNASHETIQGPVGGYLVLFRNDTSIVSGDFVGGAVLFYGNDTTSNTPTAHAAINAVASGTHADGDNPTDISFYTTPDNTATAAEAGRITQAGSYVLKGGTTTAAAGVGIIFPATQVASANANSLDDYEEGVWTPVVADATTGGNASATVCVGSYTKIGNKVTATAACVNINTTGLTAGNPVYVRGFPFATGDIAGTTAYFTGTALTSSITISAPPLVAIEDNGQTAASFSDGSTILVSDLTSTSADIWFTLTYTV